MRRIELGDRAETEPSPRRRCARRPLLTGLVAAILLAIVVTTGSVVAATRLRPGYNFGQGVYLETTLSGAQAQVPFHILQPTVLPPGYALSSVQVPNPAALPHAAQYREISVYINLTYRDPAVPARLLSIEEQPVGRPTMVEHALPGTTEEIKVDGQLATYLKGVTAEHAGSPKPFTDYTRNALVIERSRLVVQLEGSPTAGVDRTEFARIVASLH